MITLFVRVLGGVKATKLDPSLFQTGSSCANLPCLLVLYRININLKCLFNQLAHQINKIKEYEIVDLKPSNGYSENLTWLLEVHQLKSDNSTRIFSLFISCSIGCWSSKDFSVICDESKRKWNYPSWKNIKTVHDTFSRKTSSKFQE